MKAEDMESPELELSRGIYLCLSAGGSCETIEVACSGLLGQVWRRKALIGMCWANRIGVSMSLDSGPKIAWRVEKGAQQRPEHQNYKPELCVRFTLPVSTLHLGKPNVCLSDPDV